MGERWKDMEKAGESERERAREAAMVITPRKADSERSNHVAALCAKTL